MFGVTYNSNTEKSKQFSFQDKQIKILESKFTKERSKLNQDNRRSVVYQNVSFPNYTPEKSKMHSGSPNCLKWKRSIKLMNNDIVCPNIYNSFRYI